MNPSVLEEINRDKVQEFIPLFLIFGCLMLLGLIGNISLLSYVRRETRRCIASFFISVLAVIDTLVCITISFAILENSKIYMFTTDAVCKLSVFSKFLTALFSGFVLMTVSVYRYRKICCPFKRQLTMKGARIAVGCNIMIALILSFPQLFLVEIVTTEVANDYNTTVVGYDCAVKTLTDNGLILFQTILDGIYVLVFVVCSIILIFLYSLQIRAILNINRNRFHLKHAGDSRYNNENKTDPSGISDPAGGKSSANKTHNTANNTGQVNQLNESHFNAVKRASSAQMKKNREKLDSTLISSAKVSVMFFIIGIGFILTFLPFASYAIWRAFSLSKSELLFAVSPLKLFCLNSYLINSVINPIIYWFFHVDFRHYLRLCLCRCKRV